MSACACWLLTAGRGPLLVFWFVVLPLKGAGLGGGFEAAATLRTIGLDLVFGIGTALTFGSLARLALSAARAPDAGEPSAY